MNEVKGWLQSLCTKTHYCVADLELEECVVTLLFSLFLTGSALRLIIVYRLNGSNSDLYKLSDDFFDVVIFRIYGGLQLFLIYLTYKWQFDSMQIDVLVLEFLFAITAFAVNNNTYAGLLFTALSYSSWYGWFRLLMTSPIGGDFYSLVQPQWIGALLMFTTPTLISNLKYPALIEGSIARLAYSTLFFGVVVAMNASFLFIDASLAYYNIFPNYAVHVTDGVSHRLYGMRLEPLSRMGYYSAMVVLQFITSKIPHLMLNEDHLLDQLQQQEDERAEKQEVLREIRTKLHSAKDKKADQSSSSTSAPGDAGDKDGTKEEGASIGKAADIPMNFVDDSELPADCVEISAEEAIRLQESSLRKATKIGRGLT